MSQKFLSPQIPVGSYSWCQSCIVLRGSQLSLQCSDDCETSAEVRSVVCVGAGGRNKNFKTQSGYGVVNIFLCMCLCACMLVWGNIKSILLTWNQICLKTQNTIVGGTFNCLMRNVKHILYTKHLALAGQNFQPGGALQPQIAPVGHCFLVCYILSHPHIFSATYMIQEHWKYFPLKETNLSH